MCKIGRPPVVTEVGRAAREPVQVRLGSAGQHGSIAEQENRYDLNSMPTHFKPKDYLQKLLTHYLHFCQSLRNFDMNRFFFCQRCSISHQTMHQAQYCKARAKKTQSFVALPHSIQRVKINIFPTIQIFIKLLKLYRTSFKRIPRIIGLLIIEIIPWANLPPSSMELETSSNKVAISFFSLLTLELDRTN